jgi:hypothetical protein
MLIHPHPAINLGMAGSASLQERNTGHSNMETVSGTHTRQTMMIEVAGGKQIEVIEHAIKCVFELPSDRGTLPLCRMIQAGRL